VVLFIADGFLRHLRRVLEDQLGAERIGRRADEAQERDARLGQGAPGVDQVLAAQRYFRVGGGDFGPGEISRRTRACVSSLDFWASASDWA